MNKELCQKKFKRKLRVKNVFWCQHHPIFLLYLSEKYLGLFVLEVIQNFIHADCNVTPMTYPHGKRFLNLRSAAARKQQSPPTALQEVTTLGLPIEKFAQEALTKLPEGEVALCLLFRHDNCREGADCCMVTEEYQWFRSSNGTGGGEMTRVPPQSPYRNPVPLEGSAAAAGVAPLAAGSTTPRQGGRSQSPAGMVFPGDIGQDVKVGEGGRHLTTTTTNGGELQGHQGYSQSDSGPEGDDGSCYSGEVRHPIAFRFSTPVDPPFYSPVLFHEVTIIYEVELDRVERSEKTSTPRGNDCTTQ